jgi:hypothetical protein
MTRPDTPAATPAGPPPAADEAAEPKVGERRIDQHFDGQSWQVHEWTESEVPFAPAGWRLVAAYVSAADALLLARGGPRLAALEAALRMIDLHDTATVYTLGTDCINAIRAALGAAGPGADAARATKTTNQQGG